MGPLETHHMAGPSEFERGQIESLICPKVRPIARGTALYVSAQLPRFADVYTVSVAPALHKNGFATPQPYLVLDSDSPLCAVWERVQTTEMLVFDLTEFVPDVMYVLGMAHAMGRCPVLLAQEGTPVVPFDLHALRRIEYVADAEGLRGLREELMRVVRIHLAGVRAMPQDDDVT